MTNPKSSKFVPTLPDDVDFNTPTNSQGDNSIKFYQGIADCTMNDSDNLKNLKVRAKELAIDNVYKKIADYVHGFLKDRLLSFPDDEIIAIANETFKITDVKYNSYDSDDDKIVIRATVNAQIDDNDIMNCLINFFKERIALKSQIEDLKQQIDNIDLAQQKFIECYVNGDEDTIKLCSYVIQLYPNFALAYYNRGEAYYRLKKYEQAIQDCDKVIQLCPNFVSAYSFRGDAYKKLGDNAKSQADFEKFNELWRN